MFAKHGVKHMKVAVVDVAAKSGGALSVLISLLEDIELKEYDDVEWHIFTSIGVKSDSERIKFHVDQRLQNSWWYRLFWENFIAGKLIKNTGADVILSLQNTAIRAGQMKQIVYFHNVLLLKGEKKYSFLNKRERKYAVYTSMISRYTMRSLKYADVIVVQQDDVRKKIVRLFGGEKNIITVKPVINIPQQYRRSFSGEVRGILYPAAPVPFKKIEELIKCVRKYKDWFKINEYKVLITLDGSENEYSRYIFRLAQDIESIEFLGYCSRKQILDLYKNYALFICSELESYPIPFLEAEQVGNPIVCADYTYAVNELENKNNVVLFRHGDIDDMFDKIKMTFSAEIDNDISLRHNRGEMLEGWVPVVQELIKLGN